MQQRDSAISLAKDLFEETKDEKFHNNYIRPTLASYGANCKVSAPRVWHVRMGLGQHF